MGNDNYLLRSVRDTLMTQLGLAATAPLTDLPVRPKQNVVVYGSNTLVEVAYSQRGVRYRLADPEGKVIAEADGTGGPLQLKTNNLTDGDTSFSIWAAKGPGTDPGLTRGFDVKMLQTVLVQVRIDTELLTSLKESIIDYQSKAEVWVHAAQGKTRYEVVDVNEAPLGAAVKTRDGGDLQLWTKELTEDATLVIKATTSSIKEDQSDLLQNRLRVLVRPRLDLDAALLTPVVDYNSAATISLAGTQPTARYQLQLEATKGDAKPEEMPAVTGNGKTVELTTVALQEDCTVKVWAIKSDSGIAGELPVPMAIQVRPDPNKELLLVDSPAEDGTSTGGTGLRKGDSAVIKVANTQLGVCYQLRDGARPVGRPGYHHGNAGIGQAAISYEFAVGTFAGDAVYLPTGALAKTTKFSVVAYKPHQEANGVVIGSITVAVQADPA